MQIAEITEEFSSVVRVVIMERDKVISKFSVTVLDFIATLASGVKLV